MVKNKNDKRYIKSKIGIERNYFREVRKQGGMVGMRVKEIYNGANVHSATFFRHYKGLQGIARSVRKELKLEYNGNVRKIVQHGGKFRDVVYETLIFIDQHKDYFRTAMKVNNTLILEWIGKKMWKQIRKTQYQYGMKRIERVYVYEVIGVMISWIEDKDHSEERVNQYVNYIMKISSGGVSHLSLLADKE